MRLLLAMDPLKGKERKADGLRQRACSAYDDWYLRLDDFGTYA